MAKFLSWQGLEEYTGLIKTFVNNLHNDLIGKINEKADSSHTHPISNITNLKSSLDGKSDVGHTHNYAGSSSVGGAATSANKLNKNAGSGTQPVYFANGIPVATTYTLGKSVPSDAKFTDTTYSVATTEANGLMSADDKKKIGSVTGTTYTFGAMGSKTITDLRNALDHWLNLYSSTANATAIFSADTSWITAWNSGDTSTTLKAGVQWTVTNIATYSTKAYTQLRISTYGSKHIYYVARENGTWGNVSKIAFKDEVDLKQDKITGGATTITGSNLTASRALVSDANGKVAVSAITSTELGYLDNAKSNIQAQLDGKYGAYSEMVTKSLIIGDGGGWIYNNSNDGNIYFRYKNAASDTDYQWNDIKGIVNSINGKSNSDHTHNYLSTSGGTLSGNLVATGYSIEAGTLYSYGHVTAAGDMSAKTIYENGTALSSKYAPLSHTHDDRYYTGSQVDAKLAGKATLNQVVTFAGVSLGNGNPYIYTENNNINFRWYWSNTWRYYSMEDIYTKLVLGGAITHGYLTIQNDSITSSTNSVSLRRNGSSTDGFMVAGNCRPLTDNAMTSGSSSYRWKQLYAATTTINTSDRNAKRDFRTFDSNENYEKFFMDLKPLVFKFKDGESKRDHFGFVSQDVEDSLYKYNFDDKSFAGFCKDIKVEYVEDEDGNGEEVPVLDENGNEQYVYGLRYGEFTAFNTWMIQNLVKEKDRIKEENQEFKAEIAELKEENQKLVAEIKNILAELKG